MWSSPKLQVLVLCAAVAWPAAARADGVVMESYPGDRPGDAEYLLKPLMTELANRGFATTPQDLGRTIEGQLSRSGRVLSNTDLATARRLVDDGWSKWLNADFEGAVRDMTAALERFRSAPATLARDQGLRDPMRRALIGLALANKRLGDAAEATSAMAEVIRSFPDKAIDRGTFGPEAKELFEQVERDMQQRGKGSLRIDVDDRNAVLFLNERYLTLGSTTQTGLYAGRYRVYVQRGDDVGRVHIVDVEPDVDKTVAIAWGLDAALHTHDYVGFEFASEAERQRDEARFATTVARATGASGVVVVGITVVEGRRVVQGSVLLMDTATTLRRAYLPIEPVAPNASQVRALALFLAGGEATEDLVVVGAERSPRDEPGGARPYRPWKWLALGLGAAGVGTGIYLFAIDGECSTGEPPAGASCESLYDTQTPAIVATGVGAALIGAGIALWLKDEPSAGPPRRTATVAPTPGGVVFGLAGTF